MVHGQRRWRTTGTTAFGVAALVSLALAAWTLLDLARNFHDDAAVRLLPDLFGAWAWQGSSPPCGVLFVAALPARRCVGDVVGRCLRRCCRVLVGAHVLARSRDFGRYEAVCQPLLVESIPGSEDAARCADGSRLALWLLLVGVGVAIWTGRSRALTRSR